MWDPPQYICPDGDDLDIDLGERVEAAEGYGLVLRERSRRNCQSTGWRLVAQEVALQSGDLFGEILLFRLCVRANEAICDEVVHRREPGGIRVTRPADLDGRRPPGEHCQPVSSGVSGEIHKYVDTVASDLLAGIS